MPRKTAKELDTARELAYILFLNGELSKEIAGRVSVSEQTISKWVKEGSWKEKRAARTITRQELINKILNQIATLTDENEGSMTSKDADKLVKLSAVIERLDKKNSPVLAIETFIQFGNFLKNNLGTSKELTIDFIKLLNKYQDAYVTSLML